MEESHDEVIRKAQLERRQKVGELVGLGSIGSYDEDLYGSGQFDSSIAVAPSALEEEEETHIRRKLPSYTAPDSILSELPTSDDRDGDNDVFDRYRSKTIAETEDDYHARARAHYNESRIGVQRSYRDRVEETLLDKEAQQLEFKLKKAEQDKQIASISGIPTSTDEDQQIPTSSSVTKKRSRWDLASAVASSQTTSQDGDDIDSMGAASKKIKTGEDSSETVPVSQPRSSRWDQATPVVASGNSQVRSSRWDQTPTLKSGTAPAETTRSSRWDRTPMLSAGGANIGATPLVSSGMMLSTPLVASGSGGSAAPPPTMTPEAYQLLRHNATIQRLNRPMTDSELDEIIPGEAQGFIIIRPPPGYVPSKARQPANNNLLLPTGFVVNQATQGLGANPSDFGLTIELGGGLPELKIEDKQFFEQLLDKKPALTQEAQVERKVLELLLKVKNGLPIQRKQALRQLSDRAREFGPAILFNKILPLLMSPALEAQERHLLVKVIDRILYKLEDQVRPYVRDILNVIQPLLIDQDNFARIEGREIISNLAKAAGLHIMIKEMRPSLDSPDEFVRNVTARAFAVVAAALGPAQLTLFLQAVCKSKKSWQARHTGIKIVQQLAILLGCAILPYLGTLVETIAHGLTDEMVNVKVMTGLALSELATAAAPFGIERFEVVFKPLFDGVNKSSGKVLAAFLKAIGSLIPLMDTGRASYYAKEVMVVLLREFARPDDEMKKIVLQVLKQCITCEGINAVYIRSEILNPFFENFWVNRVALDKIYSRHVIDTTLEISLKIGAVDVISKLTQALRAEAEPFRKMAASAIDRILQALGAEEFSERLDYDLVDGLLLAFQRQSDDSDVVMQAFATFLIAMGPRAKPYFTQIQGVIKHRLANQSAKVRQQSCDLLSKIAGAMSSCGEDTKLGDMGVILYENLGEEYPEVLGSILGALKAIVNVIGMTSMNPPIHDLLPRLTPILKNRQEKVQENCIELVGRIADRGKDFVHPREWMRISFELLEMLKAHKLSIRQAAVSTFGYIAAAVGPLEVISTLLNNLRVQDRTNRVCTTVAIAVVAETCQPFTVLPALMNEYRVPDNNVQNGVLKALSFLFEYISETAKDYIYAVTPLLEDALMDRDAVHRQTACTAVKHLALGVTGLGAEDALIHLLNYVWPNIFETSPHVINAVLDAVEGLRVALGPTIILQYLIQGLFHPARKVRQVFWKTYNMTYIASVDALIPSYPQIEDTPQNTFYRAEADLFI